MSAHQNVNILLVDDQPARLLTYESILGGLGLNLVRASSGSEALQKLMQYEFAVVLLDVSMTGMDGFEVARLMHEHPRFEKTPIIFITGVNLTERDYLKGYQSGAVDYVSVPFVPEILRGKVAVLVELFSKRRELKELNLTLSQSHDRLAEAHATLQAERARELEKFNDTLQRANAELEQASRQKDEFLALLAHELRNPLAPILNAAHLLRAKPLPEAQLDWSREIIERQTLNLSRLVDDLLDVSRITRGKITLSKEPIDLATLIQRAVETVQPSIQEQALELTIDMPDGAIRVDGDLLRLTQALGNVLGNATKYTDRGGRITLTVRPEETDVAICVRDTGIGIPPDMLPSLFNLFTQVDDRSERAQRGLGIGLALVRTLVQMHGGSVRAHSEGVGRGSEFVIRLPVWIGNEPESVPSRDVPNPGRPHALGTPVRRRILVSG